MRYKKLLLVFVALLVASLAFVGVACCALPAIVAGSLDISPDEVGIGGTVYISLDVQNMGFVEGPATVELKIDGEVVDSQEVTLAAQGVETVTFTYVAEDPGTYTVEVNGETGTLTVTEAVVTPTPTPAVGAPTLAVGDTWVYLATYPGEDDSVYTITVADEEVVKGEDCYYLTIDIDPAAERTAVVAGFGEVAATITSGEIWLSKATLDYVKQKAPMTALGMTTTTTLTWTYTGDHGWPWEVGKTWSFDRETQAMIAVPTLTATVTIEGMEDVTVPAGTFSCYHIVQYDEDDNIIFEDWWSAEVKTSVKMIDHATFVEPETRELTSYTVAE